MISLYIFLSHRRSHRSSWVYVIRALSIHEARSKCEWKFVGGRKSWSRLYGSGTVAIHKSDKTVRTYGSVAWWCPTSWNRGCTLRQWQAESSFTFRAEPLNGQKSFHRQPCEILHCPEEGNACMCARRFSQSSTVIHTRRVLPSVHTVAVRPCPCEEKFSLSPFAVGRRHRDVEKCSDLQRHSTVNFPTAFAPWLAT